MEHLNKLYNPYDFSHPVASKELFIGRRKVLDEIGYYLHQAAKAPRPINIALLGPRASGKTSLLNMIEYEAKVSEFCVARLDLNESDAVSQLGFFFKVFDSLFNATCEYPRSDGDSFCFGGKAGKTFDVYLDMISTYMVPEEKTWCPFLFPIQFARAMSTGTGTGQMSEAIYKSDLIRIRKEVGHPIAILFDECNVLSQNRVLLEMVRNIFMNTSGFMLVFTGTADLFPIMDEVFSPIVRQFKKIDIDPFQELDETKACIQKPLESIGVEDPGELFEFGDMGQVRDVHDLTGGRPYEIQLLCHFLFRRVQMGQARTMRLDVAVLDDVLRELRRGRDMSSRPTITRIRNYQRSQLNALNFLVPCSGHATFDQLWFTAHVFQGRELADRTRLAGHLAHMSKDQVLDIQNGIITFRGDDFDKIYSKYFARQRKVFLAFPDFPLEVSFSLSMRRGCQSQLGLEFLGGMAQVGTLPASYTADASDIVYQLPDVAELNRILDTYPVDVTCDLYWALLKFARIKEGKIDLVSISVTTPFLVVSLPFVRVTVSEQGPDDLASHLEAMACRAQSLGGEVTWDIKRGVQMPTVETLARCVAATGNEELRQAICSRHTVELKREYIEKHNMESVAFHSSLISRYNPALSDSQANNLAYIHMARGEYEEAKALLLRALSQIAASEQGKSALPRPWYGEVHVPGLALFNLGVVELKLGNAKKAYELFQQVKETWNENKPKHGDILCLFIPTIGEGELELIEKKRPSASESIDKALEVAGILAQE